MSKKKRRYEEMIVRKKYKFKNNIFGILIKLFVFLIIIGYILAPKISYSDTYKKENYPESEIKIASIESNNSSVTNNNSVHLTDSKDYTSSKVLLETQNESTNSDKVLSKLIQLQNNISLKELNSTSATTTNPSKYILNIIAGGNTAGYSGDGGPSKMATMNQPDGITLDSEGNIYFADKCNQRVRKIDHDTNYITTVAGNGTAGYSGDGGPAINAQLNYPSDVAVDHVGNLYIADYANKRIRMVNKATGYITTIAGNGSWDGLGDGGPAINARISPNKITIDSLDNIYIAEKDYYRIRKIDYSTGYITTVAGNGTYGYSLDGTQATSAEFIPHNVALDNQGNMYIAEANHGYIRKVDNTTGIISSVAGNYMTAYLEDGGPATSANLQYPNDIVIDNMGNMYIQDFNNHRIRKVDYSTGKIFTIAGNGSNIFSGDNIPSTSAGLGYLYGITVDNDGNIYFIADNYLCVLKLLPQIPVLPANISAGSATGTTSVTATPGAGNHLLIKVYPQYIAPPAIGDKAPIGNSVSLVTDNYISGADISGIDTKTYKFVEVYEINIDGKVVSYNYFNVTEGVIKPKPPIIKSPNYGLITKDNQILVSGEAVPKSIVYVNFEDGVWHTVSADINGSWSYKPDIPIKDGVYDVIAIDTDSNGTLSNLSNLSNQVQVTIDTRSPAPPMISEPESGVSIKNQNLTIFGYSEPYSKIDCYVNGIKNSSFDLGKSSFFCGSLTTLQPGTYTLTETSTDRAGNVSDLCVPINITINPLAPSMVLLGTPCNGFITSDNKILFSGITNPNTDVYLWTDNDWKQICKSNNDGFWCYFPNESIADGDHVFSSGIVINGQTIVSNVVNLTIKTIAEVPVIKFPLDGIEFSNNDITITGTSESDAFVYIYVNNTTTGKSNTLYTYADSNGMWTYNLIDLDDGTYIISAKIKDIVSNISEVCKPINLIISTKNSIFTIDDVNIVKNYLLGKTSISLNEIILKEDVDGDGKITSRDYSLILKYVTGKINSFPNVNK
jgi:sugar lactone lactonase YvrE